MVSNLRKRVAAFSLAAMLTIGATGGVYATSYSSTMSIGENSTLTGKTRSYKGDAHKIKITISSRGYNCGSGLECKTYLYESKWGSDTKHGYKKMSMPDEGRTYSMSTRRVPDGKFFYYFTNRSVRYKDAFKSKKVTMSSK